jgi:hypothetical protein
MKNSLCLSLSVLALMSGCAQMQSMMPGSKPAQAQTDQQPHQTLAANPYASDNQACSSKAQSRMGMYDRPDTYPISDQERKDAYQALYASCMNEHNWQVAGPAHGSATYANTGSTTYANNAVPYANLSPAAGGNNVAQYATLSPSAGGNYPGSFSSVNAGNTVVSSSNVPGATVVVIGGNSNNAAQLSSLSPSAGGNGSSNPTVIMVQSPQAPAYNQAAYAPAQAAPYGSGGNTYYRQVAPQGQLPVAMPVPPLTKVYAPVNGQSQTVATAAAPAAYAPAVPVAAAPSYAPQPSLASANAQATGRVPISQNGTPQLENVLEQ